ncbi:MAG: hypothetical protein KJO34_03950, partial [Deltaproteobacteria bacterium]|nr:hypothetical protein [Deltaproteobacteria bacterium]
CQLKTWDYLKYRLFGKYIIVGRLGAMSGFAISISDCTSFYFLFLSRCSWGLISPRVVEGVYDSEYPLGDCYPGFMECFSTCSAMYRTRSIKLFPSTMSPTPIIKDKSIFREIC